MRLYALIGTILVLLLPFSFVSVTYGDTSNTATYGFVYYSSQLDSSIDLFDSQESSTFQTGWLDDDGVYHGYFDPVFALGIVLLLATLANIGLAFVANKKKMQNLPAIVLLAIGIGLLIVRLLALSDNDSSFYDQYDVFFFGTVTYLEIPLAFLYSLVFAILDFRQK